jgi:hypothetical protein
MVDVTIRVQENTRSDVIRIKGQLEMERGEKVTIDEAIKELIKFWRETRR